MSTSLAAREVLVLATEDDSFCQSNSKNREGIDGVIRAYRRKTRFRQKASKTSKTSEMLWEKPFQDQDLVEPILKDLLGFQG